jgi:hypothetical protein
MELKEENLNRFLQALDVAIDVVSENAPACAAANVDELQALRDLREEMREGILARNQSVPTVASYDDENLVEPDPLNAVPDRLMHFPPKSTRDFF